MASVFADEVTGNLLRAIDANLARSISADEDISRDGRARGVLCSIGLRVDSGSRLGANGSSLGWSETDRRSARSVNFQVVYNSQISQLRDNWSVAGDERMISGLTSCDAEEGERGKKLLGEHDEIE